MDTPTPTTYVALPDFPRDVLDALMEDLRRQGITPSKKDAVQSAAVAWHRLKERERAEQTNPSDS